MFNLDFFHQKIKFYFIFFGYILMYSLSLYPIGNQPISFTFETHFQIRFTWKRSFKLFFLFFFRFILRRIIIRLANNFTDIPCNLFNSVSCNETRIHSCTHRFNIVSRCCVNCPFAIIFHIWFNWIFEMMKNEFVEGKLDNFTRLVISKMWTCEGNSRCIKYMVSAAFIFCILSHRDKRYHIIINCHREDLLKR